MSSQDMTMVPTQRFKSAREFGVELQLEAGAVKYHEGVQSSELIGYC